MLARAGLLRVAAAVGAAGTLTLSLVGQVAAWNPHPHQKLHEANEQGNNEADDCRSRRWVEIEGQWYLLLDFRCTGYVFSIPVSGPGETEPLGAG